MWRIQNTMHILVLYVRSVLLICISYSLYITSAPAHLAICTIDQSINSIAPSLPANTASVAAPPPPAPAAHSLRYNRNAFHSIYIHHASIHVCNTYCIVYGILWQMENKYNHTSSYFLEIIIQVKRGCFCAAFSLTKSANKPTHNHIMLGQGIGV